jgi:DNA polymerase-4
VSHTSARHTLDGAAVRAALLDLVVTPAAGGTSWEKTRRLPEASALDEDLRVWRIGSSMLQASSAAA